MAPDPAPVAIIGASGALGFGLALRLGAAGVPVVIGSRSPERAAEAAQRAVDRVPAGRFEGYANEEAATRADIVVLSVPFRNQSETLTNLKEVLREGQLLVDATVPLAAAVGGKATRMLGVWQGSAAQQAAGDGPRRRARRLGAAHRQRRDAGRPRPRARRGRPRLRRQARRQARGRGADRAHPGPALRRLRAPGDGAHHRVADRAADLGQRPLQDARGDPDHRAARRAVARRPVVVLAGGTGGAKLARGMLDVVGEDLVVVANTGDDIEIYGAHVSPDPDLVTYWLADRIDERGWGLRDDTFHVMDGLRELGVEVWFNLGDRDLGGLPRARAGWRRARG